VKEIRRKQSNDEAKIRMFRIHLIYFAL